MGFIIFNEFIKTHFQLFLFVYFYPSLNDQQIFVKYQSQKKTMLSSSEGHKETNGWVKDILWYRRDRFWQWISKNICRLHKSFTGGCTNTAKCWVEEIHWCSPTIMNRNTLNLFPAYFIVISYQMSSISSTGCTSMISYQLHITLSHYDCTIIQKLQ